MAHLRRRTPNRPVFLGLMATVFVGCYPSAVPVAQTRFASQYACPKEQLTIRGVGLEWENFLDVVGCGHEAQYYCPYTSRDLGQHFGRYCDPRDRTAYQATDGTLHEGWGSVGDRVVGPLDPEVEAARREAAVASAAHDIPCDRAALTAVDSEIVEGCGQRVTYRTVPEVIATPPGHFQIKEGYRFTLVGRIPTSQAPAASPDAAPRPAGT